MRIVLRKITVAATALLCAAFVWSAPASADVEAQAQAIGAVPTVGALFSRGLDAPHGCTASVVQSPGGDLILTAAHCVSGTAAGWTFAPGYFEGQTPYGVWAVTGAYVDSAWSTSQNPQDDFAFLTVASQQRDGVPTTVQQVTGANALALAPAAGQQVTDIAYNAGINDAPISCTVPVTWSGSYPTLKCHGYVGGSSGSPWLVQSPGGGALVVGVIGGLHQGGCVEQRSHSSAFGAGVFLLWLRASAGIAPDSVPSPGGSGC